MQFSRRRSAAPLTRSIAAAILLAAMAAAPAAAQCVGDCNGDGRVAVGELILGVNIALGQRLLADCPMFDRSGNARVEISELLTAVNAALNVCPPPPQTATPTATSTPTPTATASPTPNLPPQVESLPVYRTFPGLEIDLPLPVSDPEGAALACSSAALPDGAEIAGEPPSLRWTPGDDQLGPFVLPFTCSDDGAPPLAAEGELVLKVSPTDDCAILDCNPATGCTTTLPDVETNCCSATPTIRVAEPDADCPEGRVMFLGRNTDDRNPIGRVQNCDHVRMFVMNQAEGASLRFNAEIRCLRTSTPFALRVRVENASRGLVLEHDTGEARPYFFRRGADGFFERRAITVPIPDPPYLDLEDSEVNLHVTLIDGDGVSVTESLRVFLTSTPLPELLGPEPTPTP